MKLFLLLAIFSSLCFGKGTIVASSGGSPIPIAFSAIDANSQVQPCEGNVIEILNLTASQLSYGLGKAASIPPFDYAYVPPGSTTNGSGVRVKPQGGMSFGDYVYIRSATGSTITTGKVLVSCFYEAKP